VYEFDVDLVDGGVKARIWERMWGGHTRTIVEETFKTVKEADEWAWRQLQRLYEKAEEFANDPISRYYGL
jgi:hypothetical protein